MLTKVVNVQKEPCDVYIGRPSRWGNPYPISQNVSREDVIAKFREYLLGQIKENPALIDEIVKTMKGRRLGCFCSPLSCHGDVYKEICDEYIEN